MAPRSGWSRGCMAELEFRRIALELKERRAQEKAAAASQSNLLPESVAEVDSRKLSPTAQAVVEQRLATARPGGDRS